MKTVNFYLISRVAYLLNDVVSPRTVPQLFFYTAVPRAHSPDRYTVTEEVPRRQFFKIFLKKCFLVTDRRGVKHMYFVYIM